MSIEPNFNEEFEDFSEADHTLIVSDLHLCEAEPIHPKYPLWKKYKTAEFFFDKDFFNFLKLIDSKIDGDKKELILNGDIFDFDSVTKIPKNPLYRTSWLEKARGLNPQEEKSKFKITHILEDHPLWVESLNWALKQGYRLIFTVGNHDLELHYPSVQEVIKESLSCGDRELRKKIRFNEWFYISNKDTLVEHGNQYDPYCVADDPINPYVRRANLVEVKVPFGNLVTRYMVNGMGFVNPHVEENYVMEFSEYLKVFFKYVMWAQPFIIWTWFYAAVIVVYKSFINRLRPPIKEPLLLEDKVEYIAKKANATPRMVRDLKELFVAPATSYPMLIIKELWLDRAFFMLIALFITVQIFLVIESFYDISFLWSIIPISIFAPLFIFYTRSLGPSVISKFKEPQERLLSIQGRVAGVGRVVYGHTHNPKHEMIGPIEHLNSGTWSPAFLDLECTKTKETQNFVWIFSEQKGEKRAAHLMLYEKKEIRVCAAQNKHYFDTQE